MTKQQKADRTRKHRDQAMKIARMAKSSGDQAGVLKWVRNARNVQRRLLNGFY